MLFNCLPSRLAGYPFIVLDYERHFLRHAQDRLVSSCRVRKPQLSQHSQIANCQTTCRATFAWGEPSRAVFAHHIRADTPVCPYIETLTTMVLLFSMLYFNNLIMNSY